MKFQAGTAVYVVGFVVFLLVFSFLLLSYTRRVDGTSMLPTLEEGDLVVLEHASFSDVHVGDIIVYDPPCSATGSSVIHRVVASSPDGFTTRGDNNPLPDQDPSARIATGPITQDCIVGKVVFVVPYVERLASLPYGANYILAALIFIAVLYSELGGRGKAEADSEQPEERPEPPPKDSTTAS
ncbi:MAG: signal peptidase I [archaeon]|nr:MAG: signal peptidase I [archaeon]